MKFSFIEPQQQREISLYRNRNIIDIEIIIYRTVAANRYTFFEIRNIIEIEIFIFRIGAADRRLGFA